MTPESLAAQLVRLCDADLSWGLPREMLREAVAALRRLAAVEAERDALLEMLKEARQMVFEWGSNAQDLFDLLPQDLARIDAAIDAAMKGTT